MSASTIGLPWVVMGDFNNALSPKDKKDGLPIPFSCISDFKNCMLKCGLVEENFQVCKHTWRRRGIATSIDKVLANYELLTTFQ